MKAVIRVLLFLIASAAASQAAEARSPAQEFALIARLMRDGKYEAANRIAQRLMKEAETRRAAAEREYEAAMKELRKLATQKELVSSKP